VIAPPRELVTVKRPLETRSTDTSRCAEPVAIPPPCQMRLTSPAEGAAAPAVSAGGGRELIAHGAETMSCDERDIRATTSRRPFSPPPPKASQLTRCRVARRAERDHVRAGDRAGILGRRAAGSRGNGIPEMRPHAAARSAGTQRVQPAFYLADV
jgi:hypothetical protein